MSESGLPDDVLQTLAERLLGTCMLNIENEIELIYEGRGEAVPEYDPTEVPCDLLDYSVETCQGCGWWMECCELCCGHDVTGYCEQCRVDDGYCEDCQADRYGED